MRALFAACGFTLVFAASATQSESLEATFARQCSQGGATQSEACAVLAKALQDKQADATSPPGPGGPQPIAAPLPAPAHRRAPPPAAVDAALLATWGPLARLVGTSWTGYNPETDGQMYVDLQSFSWFDGGKAIRYAERTVGANTVTIDFRPTGEPGVLMARIQDASEKTKTRFRTKGDGLLVSDWYEWPTSFLGAGGGAYKQDRLIVTGDGRFYRDFLYVQDESRPGFAPPNDTMLARYKRLTDEEIATVLETGQANAREIMAEHLRKEAEAERQASRERAANWSMVMGAIDGALDAGIAVANERAAQSQYELDATLAQMNAQLAAQREAGSAAGTQSASAMREATGIAAQPATSSNLPASSPSPYRPVQGPGTGSWATAGSDTAAGDQVASGGSASTRDDPARCLSAPVTSAHRCDARSGYKAAVSNTCAVAVDVKLCFMTADGWNCQANYGLAPHDTWEPGWCHASSDDLFQAVRYSDSNEPLASP